jgi:putative ABC transport system permease protein
LANLPGVAAVVQQESVEDTVDIERHPSDRASGPELERPVTARLVAAPAGYFPLVGNAFVRGRDFEPAERLRPGAVVIDSQLASRLFGTADPIGRQIVAGAHRRATSSLTIVGVVDDLNAGHRAGERPGRQAVARLFVPAVRTTGHFLIRTHGPADPLLPDIRLAALVDAPAHPIISARTLAAIEASERRAIIRNLSIAGAMCGLALLLSAIGLYAVVAFAVGQRVREIGIHTALGASGRQVVGRFVRIGLGLSVAGLTLGLALGIAGARLIMAVEGKPLPEGIVGLAGLVAFVVTGVALLASWIPARRAAHVDPLEALRVE